MMPTDLLSEVQVLALDSLKSELERFGADHDARTPEPTRRMLNITRDTGEFLRVIVGAIAATRVLEIGTSNGYSTLWLAEAVMPRHGMVTTIESDPTKLAMASGNFERSGLGSMIAQIHDDAGPWLDRAAAGAFDVIFVDSERGLYVRWWPSLHRALRTGGLMIVDNATSHPHEVAEFNGVVEADQRFSTCQLPVGKGEFVALKIRT